MILDLPEVKLEGEDFLAVYTHRATMQPGSDWEKQAFFGGKLLDLAITHHWLAQTDPSLSAEEIVAKLDDFLNENDLLHQCIEKYELEGRLVRPEPTPVGIQECRDFLCLNAAKLWNHGGMSAVQGWISALIQPGSVPPHVPQATGPSARIEPLSMNGLRLSPSQSPASGSPVASTSAAANGSDPLSFVTLQIFNEHAGQKKKHNVSWQATSSGDAHCLLWAAQCSLDGQVCGVGQGPSKKIAQEKAAREVWRTMGWSLVPSDPSSLPQSPRSPTFAQSLDSSLPPAYSQGDAGLEWLTLSTFTHVVNKRRLSVEWRPERSGEPHLPTWRLACILDGEEKGTGVGNNTKDAKLFAARDAWKNMGWSMTPT